MLKARRWFAVLVAVALTAGGPRGAGADSFFDDFLSYSGSVYTSYSSFSQWTITPTGNEIRITKPAGGPATINSGGFGPLLALHGDYDIQVRYKLNAYAFGDQAQINLFTNSFASVHFVMDVERGVVDTPFPGDYFVFTPGGGVCGKTPTSDTIGYLRATRTGNQVTGWRRSPAGAWVPICTRTIGTMPMRFLLVAQNNVAYPAFDVEYDSLSVSAQTIQWELGTATSTVTPGAASGCIATATPCATLPVDIARTDATGARGASVTIQLSSNLELCSGLSSITEGTYLSSVGATTFQKVDNGGGSYTIDCAILGLPCGATAASGTLFNVAVKRATGAPDGVGSVTVTDVVLRDCNNGAIAAGAGPAGTVTLDGSAPTAITSLSASQVKVGNDGDGTTKIHLAWPAVEAGATVEVYRAGFGNHPEYDDPPTPGSVPATPAYPPGGPWVLTAVTSSGASDEVAWPARDFWYYVAFVRDACGNVSAASNRTNGTLNYHLGDVSNGFTAGVGDNLVGTVDISLLGANYGLTGVAVNPVNYLDVGPTTNFSADARPTTDNKINFEDMVLFAINHGTVSAPGVVADRAVSPVDVVSLATDGEVALGRALTARVRLSGSGRIQALSTTLSWNPRAVEPIGFVAGDDVIQANGIMLSPAPGTLDAALLGVREVGFAGEAELARVTFRVIGEGDPGIAVGEVIARDANNQAVALSTPVVTAGALPTSTRLLAPMPNPASSSSLLSFSLAKAGRVDLAVYSVDGRRVKSVLAEEREAGFHNVSWDGAAEDGRRVPAGVYFVRMITADGVRESRTVTLIGR